MSRLRPIREGRADHPEGEPVIKVRGLVNRFGDQVVHDHLDLDVQRGEVLGVVGGSGTGKSVLLRTIIGLNHARGRQHRGARPGHRRALSDAERRKLEIALGRAVPGTARCSAP